MLYNFENLSKHLVYDIIEQVVSKLSVNLNVHCLILKADNSSSESLSYIVFSPLNGTAIENTYAKLQIDRRTLSGLNLCFKNPIGGRNYQHVYSFYYTRVYIYIYIYIYIIQIT